MDIEDKIIICLVVIILLFYVISMINRFTAFDSPSEVKYIYPQELNNGDLLCVSYNNIASAFVGTFTNSIWIHVGMVWVDPNTQIRYVLEGAMYGNSQYKNFFKIPVDRWMHINRKNIMSHKKYFGPEIDSVLMMREFEQFINFSKLEGLNPTWLRFQFNFEYSKPITKSKYTCFEVIIILGQELKIFKKDKIYSSYYPCDLVNDGIKFEDGVSYSKNVQIRMTDFYSKILHADLVQFSQKHKK